MRRNRDHLPVVRLDLTDPAQARRFLNGFRMPDGERILRVKPPKGREVEVSRATDQQIVDFASKVYLGIYAKGVGSFEDLH